MYSEVDFRRPKTLSVWEQQSRSCKNCHFRSLDRNWDKDDDLNVNLLLFYSWFIHINTQFYVISSIIFDLLYIFYTLWKNVNIKSIFLKIRVKHLTLKHIFSSYCEAFSNHDSLKTNILNKFVQLFQLLIFVSD